MESQEVDTTNLAKLQELPESGPVHCIKILQDGRIALALGSYNSGAISIYKFKEDGKTLERVINKEKLVDKQINHVNQLSDGMLTCCGFDNTWKLMQLTDSDLVVKGTFKGKDDSGIIYQVQQFQDGSVVTCDDKHVLKWKKDGDNYSVEKDFPVADGCYQLFEVTMPNQADNYLIVPLPNEEKIKFIKTSDFTEFKDNEIEKQDSCRWQQEMIRLDGANKSVVVVGTVEQLILINADHKQSQFVQDLGVKEFKMLSAFETIPGTDSFIASTEFFYDKEEKDKKKAYGLVRYICVMEYEGGSFKIKNMSKEQMSPDLIRCIRRLPNGLILIGGADDCLRVLGEQK